MMSLRALIRSIVLATSLLAGLGQSVDALAHGVAHAHAAEHHGSAPLQVEVTPPDHQHGHVHAIVDTGLKSRIDLIPFLVSPAPAHPLLVSAAVEEPTPNAGSSAPLPERRHTSASPRAPPSR